MAYDDILKKMRDELFDEVEKIISAEYYKSKSSWFDKEDMLTKIKKLFEEKIS